MPAGRPRKSIIPVENNVMGEIKQQIIEEIKQKIKAEILSELGGIKQQLRSEISEEISLVPASQGPTEAVRPYIIYACPSCPNQHKESIATGVMPGGGYLCAFCTAPMSREIVR